MDNKNRFEKENRCSRNVLFKENVKDTMGRTTNEEVLRRAGAAREVMANIQRKQLKFVVMFLKHMDQEKICLHGRLDGREPKKGIG